MDSVTALDDAQSQDLDHNRSLGMDDAELKKRYQVTHDKLIKEPRFYHTLCFICAAKVRLNSLHKSVSIPNPNLNTNPDVI